MAKIVKIEKIEFNRHPVKCGELQAEEFETFELGICDVVEIAEGQLIDKTFCTVLFSTGAQQDIYNVSRVYWATDD